MDRGWTGKSYGGYFGNKCFALLLKLGLFPAYLLLVFVAAYFMFFRRAACAGGVRFLSRVDGRKVGAFSPETYKLLMSFGVCLLDRAAYYFGSKKIEIDDECGKVIEPLLADGRGAVVLTAHVGGWEMSGAELFKYGRRVFVLGVDNEDPKIRALGESMRKVDKPEISGGYGATANIEAYAALKGGAIVAMHADRYAGGRFSEADFFGGKVKAPTAAYHLAKAANAAVVQTVCVREKLFKYRMSAFPPIDAANLAPEECAQIFMRNLQSVATKYKYQWFNFYDFWK